MFLERYRDNKITIAALMVVAISISMGSSALLETFGSFSTEADVERSIFVDGNHGELQMVPVKGDVRAGKTLVDTHHIENRGGNGINLSIISRCMMGREEDPVSGTSEMDIRWTEDSGEETGACNGIRTRFIRYPGIIGYRDKNKTRKPVCDRVIETRDELDATNISDAGFCINFTLQEPASIKTSNSTISFLSENQPEAELKVLGKNTTLERFTSRSGGLKISGKGLKIRDAIITGEGTGITVRNAEDTVLDNIFLNSSEAGLRNINSTGTVGKNLTVQNSEVGISFEGGNGVTLSSSIIRNCKTGLIADSSLNITDQLSVHSNRRNFHDTGFGSKIDNHNSTLKQISIDSGQKLYFGIVNSFSVALKPGDYYLESRILPG